MKPSPYQISAFTQVARAKSFSRAAEAMGVTQSSVTQHVAKLEKAMGVQLFIRRRDGLEMTRAGRDLFDISDRLLVLEQQIEERIAAYGDLSAGALKLIANAPRPAMPIIAEFSRLYPGVQIEFSLHDWTTAMARLRERSVDIAIVTEPDTVEGAEVFELERTPYLAYVHVDHRLAGVQSMSLAEIADETVILPEDGSFTQRMVQQSAETAGVRLSRVIKTTTFPVVKEAVLHQVGIGIFLENSMAPSARLVGIPIRDMPEHYRHCLITPHDKTNLRLIRSFLDLARGRIA